MCEVAGGSGGRGPLSVQIECDGHLQEAGAVCMRLPGDRFQQYRFRRIRPDPVVERGDQTEAIAHAPNTAASLQPKSRGAKTTP